MSEASQKQPEPKALKSTLNLPIGQSEKAAEAAPKPLKATLNLPIAQ